MELIDLNARRMDLFPQVEAARQRLGAATRACYEARPIPLTPLERRWNRFQALAMFGLIMIIVGIVELQGYLYAIEHQLNVLDQAFAIGVLIVGFVIACLCGWATLTDYKQLGFVRYDRRSVPAHVIWSDIRAPDLADLHDEIVAWNRDVPTYNDKMRQLQRGELTLAQVEAEIQAMFARSKALNERIDFCAHQLWSGRPLGEYVNPQPSVIVRKAAAVKRYDTEKG